MENQQKITNEILEFQQEMLNNASNKLKLMRERGWFLLARTSEKHANAIQTEIDKMNAAKELLEILTNA
jgi:hypothetical protein